jgi:glycerol-3-phosphate dehydrogenase
MRELEAEVVIIGGGVTGTGVMRDLALRAIHCVLIDRKDLNAGASGGNHGLLHSGGRYASGDRETAAECQRESDILKRVAAGAIDPCGGLFVAVEGDDEAFADAFPGCCAAAGIPCEALTAQQALEREPGLSERLIAAYRVPDASIDPFRITLANVQHARQLGDSEYLPHTELVDFEKSGGRIAAAICRDQKNSETLRIRAAQFVNASGAWSKIVAERAGCHEFNLLYSKGTLIISNARLSQGVINRLRKPADGDILVPGGTVSLLGTTSDNLPGLNDIHPTVDEVDRILKQGIQMMPALAHTRFIRAFSGVRPLMTSNDTEADGRKVSRGFMLFDHEGEGIGNFVTIAGGKLTTFRLMAEKTADLVTRRLGNSSPCRTADIPLPEDVQVRWTEPGYAARHWYRQHDKKDAILCECEMVSKSVVDNIIDRSPGHESDMTLKAIGLRSRIGKGTCQGSFCGMRVTSYLYDRRFYRQQHGMRHMKSFVEGRFKGIRPVLWGEQMSQIELAETMHCGLMELDLLNSGLPGNDSAEGTDE